MKTARDWFVLDESYELPDKSTITLGNLRFRPPEVLFEPSLVGKGSPGVHRLLFDTIMNCDSAIQADLFKNIVLAGGNTMLPGLTERLLKELKVLAPSTVDIKIIAPPERKCSAWIGGSMLASSKSLSNAWISKEDYDESGPMIVNQNCF